MSIIHLHIDGGHLNCRRSICRIHLVTAVHTTVYYSYSRACNHDIFCYRSVSSKKTLSSRRSSCHSILDQTVFTPSSSTRGYKINSCVEFERFKWNETNLGYVFTSLIITSSILESIVISLLATRCFYNTYRVVVRTRMVWDIYLKLKQMIFIRYPLYIKWNTYYNT